MGAPQSATIAFPINAVLGRIDTLGLQLWEAAPEQYQEYDRLKTEAAFKSGVISPLFVASFLIGDGVSWWVTPIVLGAMGVLSHQAQVARVRAEEMVATALYLGTIEIPLLQALAEQLQRLDLDINDSEDAWTAGVIVALERLGEFHHAEVAVSEGWHYAKASEDQGQEFIDFLQEHGSSFAGNLQSRIDAPEGPDYTKCEPSLI